MSNTNTGGPAFPFSLHIGGSAGIVDAEECGAGGMTLRDYFAAKAMQGLLAGKLKTVNMQIISTECYAMADAMLAARSAS